MIAQISKPGSAAAHQWVVWGDCSHHWAGTERPQRDRYRVRARCEETKVGFSGIDGSDNVGAVIVGDRQRKVGSLKGVNHYRKQYRRVGRREQGANRCLVVSGPHSRLRVRDDLECATSVWNKPLTSGRDNHPTGRPSEELPAGRSLQRCNSIRHGWLRKAKGAGGASKALVLRCRKEHA